MNVSYSKMQTYKSCRRLYELQYIYNLRTTNKSEALSRGSSYHEKVEQILKCGEFKNDEDIKSNAMAIAFRKYIYPHLNAKVQEEWFSYTTKYGDTVIGRIDALNCDGKLIEHKTTSADVSEYWSGLENDEQILTYMLAYHTNCALYTVCKTPTIRQKKNESDEEFQQRCVDWYDEETENKINMQELYRSDEQLSEFAEVQALTIREMNDCTLFYKNPSHCQKWGRICDYFPICQHYDAEQEYMGFEVMK